MKTFKATVTVSVPVNDEYVGSRGYIRKGVRKLIAEEVARTLHKKADSLKLLVDIKDIGSIIEVTDAD